MTRRGDVVIVDFPFTDVAQAKARPAVVVQNDRDNQRLRKTVVALITGNLRRSGDPSHLFIDPATPDGALCGLHALSLVSCNNLFTVEQKSIIRTIGHLSSTTLQTLGGCLSSALDLP
jgi:mRNA interferase MazF